MIKIITIPFLFLLFYSTTYSIVNVVTTTTDLASIAKEIGQDLIKVESLARSNDDLHYLSAQPNFILKVNKAQVLIAIGLDLEVGWLPLILQQSRNPKIQKGAIGYCDVSVHVPILQLLNGEVNRSMGDIHVLGNPHYWTEPVRGVLIAKNILETLKKVDYDNTEKYEANFLVFKNKVKALLETLQKKTEPYKGFKFISHHNDYIYLADRFSFNNPAIIEGKPGVLPGPFRVKEVIELVKKEKIGLIITAPWQPSKYANEISKATGIKHIVIPIQTQENQTWLEMIEQATIMIVNNIENK